jgi:hypothetical protein
VRAHGLVERPQYDRAAMNKDVHVGDLVELPSGLVFNVTFPSDGARPWRACNWGTPGVFNASDSSGTSTFYGGRMVPLKVQSSRREAVADGLEQGSYP